MRITDNCVNFNYKTAHVDQQYKKAFTELKSQRRSGELSKADYKDSKKMMKQLRKSDRNKAIIKAEDYEDQNPQLKKMNNEELTNLLHETKDKDVRNIIKHRRKVNNMKKVANVGIDVANSIAKVPTTVARFGTLAIPTIPGKLLANAGLTAIDSATNAGANLAKNAINRV